MSSTTAKKVCSICRKSGDVFTCRGCRQPFCAKHVDEHREELSRQIENLAEQYDLLRNDLDREGDAQNLILAVNKWEQESIAKVCVTAEAIRTDLQEWIDKNNIDVKIPFERITNELRSCQETDDYTETDLKRWVRQLEEYREKMQHLPFVDNIDTDEPDHIFLLKLKSDYDHITSMPISRATIATENETLSIPETNILVRERFEDVCGGARITEDGLLASYAGPWLGVSTICGVNLYSSGTHHIRFRVLEKFYDSPSFCIVTASQQNTKRIAESVSANGWWNFDYPIVNGEREIKVDRDKVIRAQDELTFTLDCDRRQLFLKHHRTKRLLHLPVDIRACPFPWKMLIILHRRGDALRIIGGTLSLTREHVSSRFSDKTKM